MFFGGYCFGVFNTFVVGGGGLLSTKIYNVCLLLASLIGAEQILFMIMCTE